VYSPPDTPNRKFGSAEARKCVSGSLKFSPIAYDLLPTIVFCLQITLGYTYNLLLNFLTRISPKIIFTKIMVVDIIESR